MSLWFYKFSVLAFGSHKGKGLGRSALNNPHIFEEKRLKISYKLGYSLEIL